MKISDYAKAQGWLKRHASSENSAGEWEKYVALNTTPELDEAIKTIDDKFGPGTVFPASEAPIPPMTDQQAIFEFGQRNPRASGGRIGFSDPPGFVKTKLSQKGLEQKRGARGPSLQTQANIDLITPVRQKYIELKEAQINNPKGGTLKNFPNYERFLIQEIDSVKDTADAKKLISSTQYYIDPPEKLSISRKRLLDNLIDIENKILGREGKAGHELAIQAGYVYKTGKRVSGKTTTAPSGSFKNLINIEQKKLNRIDEVFNKLDKGLISIDDIAKQGGTLISYINEPFGFKSTESFSKLLRGKKYKDRLDEIDLLNKSSFIQKYKGRGVLANEAQNLFEQGRTGGKRFTQITQAGPIKKIFDFADRHIERGGELIKRIDDNTFIYNNKIFSSSPGEVDKKVLQKLGLQNKKIIDLVLEGPKQKEFTEIFNAFDKLKEYETMERTHPVTGKKTNLTKLLQEADYIAGGKDRLTAKNIFSRNPFEIDHFGSVKDDPFKNIRIIPRTINQAAGQFQRGVSTFKDIKQAEDFIGYSFTGDPLQSINQYIDTEIQRGQNPDYTGRSRKIAAAKTKAIDTAASQLGQTGTRGGTILTQEIPKGVFGDKTISSVDKRFSEAYTGVPTWMKTKGGKLAIGSRPVTGKEIISVAERDEMARQMKDRLLKQNWTDFLPKKLSTPLEVGQKIIKGVTKKDGGRIPFRYGKKVIKEAAKKYSKKGLMGLLSPAGLAAILTPESAFDVALEAAFAPELVKSSIGATKGMKNRKVQKATQQVLNLLLPTKRALQIARIAQPAGITTLAAQGLAKVAKDSEPNYYIGPDGEPTFYNRENASDVLPTFMDIYEQASKIAKEENISYNEALHKINPERFHKLRQ